MATADFKLATDATLESIVSALGAAGVLAKDATLQDIATALGSTGLLHADLGNIHTDLGTTIHGDLGNIHTDLGSSGTIHEDLDNIHEDLGTTIHGDLEDVHEDLGTTIHGDLGENGILASLLNGIVEVLASVKSVNGKYGVVVLDSGDILISKNTVGSKTVKAVLTELETAVEATPLAFTAQLITGTTDHYKIIVTQGTPS